MAALHSVPVPRCTPPRKNRGNRIIRLLFDQHGLFFSDCEPVKLCNTFLTPRLKMCSIELGCNEWIPVEYISVGVRQETRIEMLEILMFN